MMTIPALALVADTLLVRPVDVPAPWYSVATGILSIVVTLLLLGIAVALLGMARALKGAEKNLGGRMQGLADEVIPLARNLNHIATQLSEVTVEARTEIRRISGTIDAVDDAVRDAIDAGESRLAQFGTLLDAVQDEAHATIASATGLIRGVRTGAGSMASSLFRRNGGSRPHSKLNRKRREEQDVLEEADVRARLAALEAALAELEVDDDDDAEVTPRWRREASFATSGDPGPQPDDEWDDDDDISDDESDLDDDDLDDDDDDDEIDDEVDDEVDDIDNDDDDDDIDFDDEDDAEPDVADVDRPAAALDPEPQGGPRHGGPRIRTPRPA